MIGRIQLQSIRTHIALVWSRRFMAVALVVGVVACAGSYQHISTLQPEPLRTAKTILVIPPENLAGFPNAELAWADVMASKLRGWDWVQVRELPWISTQLRAVGLRMPDSRDYSSLAAVARLVGADAVLGGVLYEYGFLKEFRAVSEQAVISVRTDLVSAKDGSVIWSATSVDSKGNELSASRPSVSEVAATVAEELVRRMHDEARLLQAFAAEEARRKGSGQAAVASTAATENEGRLQLGDDRDMYVEPVSAAPVGSTERAVPAPTPVTGSVGDEVSP